MTGDEAMILVEGVRKAFGSTLALQGVDLRVEAGTVQALLGRNGAGKSTLVRILSTLLEPDSGRAWIGGRDVVREARWVRPLIGLAGQAAAIDPTLTGRENLELVGRLYGLSRGQARARAGEVLERLSLSAAGDRRVFTYSGGMRRRVDLGASLVGRPLVLIMDEPTTGLDPGTRLELWRLVEDFAREGTTVLLTTQYLEEADRLANQIAVIERGQIVAAGTSSELKDRLGQDMLEVRVRNGVDVERMRQMLVGVGSGEPVADLRWQKITVPTVDPVATLLSAGDRVAQSGIAVEDLGWRRPTLDDVFLSLTASRPAGAAAGPPPPPAGGNHAPGPAVPRPPRWWRRLSYLAAVVLGAALALAVVLVSSRSSSTPRHRAVHRRALAPVATADTVLKSTRGITGERVVALGTPVGALTADTNGNVWASEPARGAVARVATGTVRAETFRVGGHPGALAAGNDRIWVADSALGPLAGLNPSTGKALPATSLAAAPTAVAVNPDDQSACAIDSSGTVTHVASTGAVLAADHAAETPTGVACGEGWVWAVQPSPAALIRMGADGGIRQFDGGPSPVAATLNRGVWIANRNGTVTVFDPDGSSLRVTREVTVAPELDGIDATETGSTVWAFSRQTRTLYRIANAAQPAVTGTVVLRSAPVAIALSGQSIWVATQDGNLTELRQ